MPDAALSPKSLSPAACRDEETLKRFVKNHVSANAWPIESKALLRRIQRDGLDQTTGNAFALTAPALAAMMRQIYRASRRAERMLAIDNAFHRALHNFEVFVRLLVLEWPPGTPMPEAVRRAPRQAYLTLDSVTPVALGLAAALQGCAVSGSAIARAALAALGHDYGHTGGTDRTDSSGRPLPLTHEAMAEKHMAGMGLKFGYPPALILESLAGIRATTFYSRAGSARVQPSNAFEMRITLADVTGCVLPPDRWLTHVAVPVLLEKLPLWKRRLADIAARHQAASAPTRDSRAADAAFNDEELAAKRSNIIRDLREWLLSERRFLLFIADHKLEPVPGALQLWGAAIQQTLVLIEAVLARQDLLGPLAGLGSEYLEIFARQFSNVHDLRDRLTQDDIDLRLRELLVPFVCPTHTGTEVPLLAPRD